MISAKVGNGVPHIWMMIFFLRGAGGDGCIELTLPELGGAAMGLGASGEPLRATSKSMAGAGPRGPGCGLMGASWVAVLPGLRGSSVARARGRRVRLWEPRWPVDAVC